MSLPFAIRADTTDVPFGNGIVCTFAACGGLVMTNGLIGTAGVISEMVDVPMGPSVEWLFASALRFIFPMRIAVGSP